MELEFAFFDMRECRNEHLRWQAEQACWENYKMGLVKSDLTCPARLAYGL